MLGRVWRSLIGPALGAYIPLGAATLVLFATVGAGRLMRVALDPETLIGMSDEEILAMLGPFLLAAGVAVILQVMATSFVSLAAARVVRSELEGSPIGGGEAARQAVGLIGPVLAASLFAGLLVLVGMVLLIAPGIWLAISFSMIAPVIAFEQPGVIGSLRRSFRLVRGRWWPTLGYLVMVGLMAGIAGQLIQLVGAPLSGDETGPTGLALVFVLGTLVQGLVAAAVGVMTAVWYLDLRVRKEVSPP